MTKYIKQILEDTPSELMKGTATLPAAKHLFNFNEKAEKLDTATAITFHHLVAQLLYVAKRTRSDILTCISFLTTRIRCPEVDN